MDKREEFESGFIKYGIKNVYKSAKKAYRKQLKKEYKINTGIKAIYIANRYRVNNNIFIKCNEIAENINQFNFRWEICVNVVFPEKINQYNNNKLDGKSVLLQSLKYVYSNIKYAERLKEKYLRIDSNDYYKEEIANVEKLILKLKLDQSIPEKAPETKRKTKI